MPTFSDYQNSLSNRKNRNFTGADREIAGFNEGQNNALENVRQQRADASRAARLNSLEKLTTEQAKQSSPYAMDARDNSLEAAAMGNPATAALMQSGMQDPEQPGLSAAMNAARQLGGAGSFLPGVQQVGNEFGGDINMIRESAMGRGPSAAEHLARASLDQSARDMRSVAAGGRGGTTAAGLRAAIGAGNQANQASIAGMSALRANEQLAAQAQLPGAQAARMAGLTGAANAETARQQAGGQAGVSAGGLAVAGQEARNQALNAAGGLHAQGVQTAVGARGVQAGVARDAAADAEEQKRRALAAQGQLANTQIARDQMRNQRVVQRMAGEITPATALGIGANVGGQALAMAIPGKK